MFVLQKLIFVFREKNYNKLKKKFSKIQGSQNHRENLKVVQTGLDETVYSQKVILGLLTNCTNIFFASCENLEITRTIFRDITVFSTLLYTVKYMHM